MRPGNFHIMVQLPLIKKEEITTGGIILPGERPFDEMDAAAWGTVLAIGPAAGMGRTDISPETLGYGVGDRVVFDRYAGKTITLVDGSIYRFMNEDDVMGILEEGDEVLSRTEEMLSRKGISLKR